MVNQPPLSRTSNLPVQTHFPVPSLQPYTLNVPTCAPLSSQLQIVDGTDWRYRPEQFLKGMKTRTIHQPGPEPTSPNQKHIWHVRGLAFVDVFIDGSEIFQKLICKTVLRLRLYEKSTILQRNIETSRDIVARGNYETLLTYTHRFASVFTLYFVKLIPISSIEPSKIQNQIQLFSSFYPGLGILGNGKTYSNILHPKISVSAEKTN